MKVSGCVVGLKLWGQLDHGHNLVFTGGERGRWRRPWEVTKRSVCW